MFLFQKKYRLGHPKFVYIIVQNNLCWIEVSHAINATCSLLAGTISALHLPAQISVFAITNPSGVQKAFVMVKVHYSTGEHAEKFVIPKARYSGFCFSKLYLHNPLLLD